MTEVTGRVDMNSFSQKVGLTINQTMEQVQTLAKMGFVTKTGGGFGVTEKGKNALKAQLPVSLNMKFEFYVGIGQPTGASAGSIKEFHDIAKTVAVLSLEFHLHRGDFENWFRTSGNDAVFADELACMKKAGPKGENLRKAILLAMESRYSIQTQ